MDWQEAFNHFRKFSFWLVAMFMILAPFFSSSIEVISGSFQLTAFKGNTPHVPTNENKNYSTEIQQCFRQASLEFDVPLQLLLAIAFVEKRWQDQEGTPRQVNGYGVMHLASNTSNHTLDTANQLTHVPKELLKNSIQQNIRGAAAVLSHIGQTQNNGVPPGRLEDWYKTAAEYSGIEEPLLAKWYADEVFRLIHLGARQEIAGEDLYLEPTEVALK